MPCKFDPQRKRKYGILGKLSKDTIRRRLDPQPIPEPIDVRGFDHTLVRLVPEIDNLVEVQIELPKHQWDEVREILKDSPDVDIDEENRRIVRRGQKNVATNIFIDSE